MKSLVVLLCLLSSVSFAQDLDFSGYKRSLINGNTKKGLNTLCTNSKGENFRIGQKGYDTCLNEGKIQKSTAKAPATEAKPAN